MDITNATGPAGDRPEASARPPSAAAVPLWRKAPVLLLRYPEILAATAITALLLAIATAAGTLFLAAAGTAAIGAHSEDLVSPVSAVRVAQYGAVPGLSLEESTARRGGALSEAFAGVAGLGDPVVTTLGVAPRLSAPSGTGRSWPVQLVSRTGALDEVDRLAGAANNAGVWVPNFIAKDLGLGPGDEIVLSTGRRTSVDVAGVYRALLFGRPTDYWATLSEYIYPPPGSDIPPPQFLIADPQLFYELDAELDDSRPLVRWEFPLETGEVSVADARELVADVRTANAQIDDQESAVGAAFSFPEFTTSLPDLVERAEETVTGIEAPIRLLSLASVAVALLMIGAACVYGVRRRRVEIALLSARGMGPLMLGARAAVEAAPVVVIAVLAGWAAAIPLIAWAGPSNVFGDGAVERALGWVAASGAVALVIIFVVSAVAARREGELSLGRIPGAVARVPWEIVVLLLAGAAYYAVNARGVAPVESADDPVRVDVFLVLFPILLIAAGAGILAKALARLLPRLRAAGQGWPTAAYLASRRIASAPRLVHTLIAGSALAAGTLLFASTLTYSVDATTTAKAQVATGSDVNATLFTGAAVPDDLPFPHTTVERLEQMSLSTTNARATLLVIDPATFQRAAFWDAGFADQPLDELVALLRDRDGERLPAIVTRAGLSAGDKTTIEVFNTTFDLDIKAGLDAWPGMEPHAPTVIVAADALEQTAEATGESLEGAGLVTELWGKGDPDAILDALDDAGVSLAFVSTAQRVAETPALLATRWTLRYLQALAIAGGFAIVAGMLLYLQARRRSGVVAFALATRMGLGGRTNRVSGALELAFLLMTALVIGIVVGLIAALLTFGHFDLIPELPPGPLLKVPVGVIGATAIALLVAAWLGAARMHSSVRRANVVEVLRLAE